MSTEVNDMRLVLQEARCKSPGRTANTGINSNESRWTGGRIAAVISRNSTSSCNGFVGDRSGGRDAKFAGFLISSPTGLAARKRILTLSIACRAVEPALIGFSVSSLPNLAWSRSPSSHCERVPLD